MLQVFPGKKLQMGNSEITSLKKINTKENNETRQTEFHLEWLYSSTNASLQYFNSKDCHDQNHWMY